MQGARAIQRVDTPPHIGRWAIPGFLGVLFYLFGQDQLVGQIANLLMAAATFFLQLELTRRIFNSEAAARLGVLLLTIYPNHVGYTAFTLTEIYFTFLLLLGIYLYLVRRGWIWVFFSGLVFGLATLTKPQVIFLPWPACASPSC